jgi:hypothetical protein
VYSDHPWDPKKVTIVQRVVVVQRLVHNIFKTLCRYVGLVGQGIQTSCCRPVFPKVRSPDHFWYTGIFNLVCDNENSSNFKLICYKKGNFRGKTSYFMVSRRLCRDFVVRKIFFTVCKLKKFGKHCCRQMVVVQRWLLAQV